MLDARYIQEAAALLNPETFIILQKHAEIYTQKHGLTHVQLPSKVCLQ